MVILQGWSFANPYPEEAQKNDEDNLSMIHEDRNLLRLKHNSVIKYNYLLYFLRYKDLLTYLVQDFNPV